MTKDTAKFLMEAAENAGVEATLYENYSGRGMFNKETQGIVVKNPIKLFAAAIFEAYQFGCDDGAYDADCPDGDQKPRYDMNNIYEDLQNLQRDSMGLDTILY